MSHLYPFQRDALKRAHDVYDGRAIFGHEMGLGKTVMALKYLNRYVSGPAVVVCPASLKENWKREAERHIARRATVLSGMTPHVSRLPRGDDLWIVNYDVLRRTNPYSKTWVELLKKVKPGIVVCDESHYVKSRDAKRSRAVKELCQGTPHVLFLTGTAILSRPIELWHQLSVVKPELFPAEHKYGCYYCGGYKDRYGWNFKGATHVDKLHAALTGDGGCLIRKTKDEVLDQLPPKTRTVVPFELTRAGRADYNDAVLNFVTWLAKRDRAKAARALMAEMIAKIGYLKRLAAEHKLPLAIQWVRDFLEGSDEKLLLFGIHHFVLDAVTEEFGRLAVGVDGRTPKEKRQPIYDRFNDDPGCRLFVGNLHAAGVGWSCRSASNVAAIELDWVPANHSQAEGRIEGIKRGTGRPIVSSFLVAENTIETDLCDVLQVKSGVCSAVLDGKPAGDLKLWDTLAESLVRANRALPKRKRAAS